MVWARATVRPFPHVKFTTLKQVRTYAYNHIDLFPFWHASAWYKTAEQSLVPFVHKYVPHFNVFLYKHASYTTIAMPLKLNRESWKNSDLNKRIFAEIGFVYSYVYVCVYGFEYASCKRPGTPFRVTCPWINTIHSLKLDQMCSYRDNLRFKYFGQSAPSG